VTGGYSVRVRALLTGEPVGWVREAPRRNHL
jgi:hypothetical protein